MIIVIGIDGASPCRRNHKPSATAVAASGAGGGRRRGTLAALYSSPDPLETMFRLSGVERLRYRTIPHESDKDETAAYWRLERPHDKERAR